MRADRPDLVAATPALSPLEQAAARAAVERQTRTGKEELKRLGVVPTPSVLVRFALSRVAHALRHDFGLPEGLASAEVELVDPALGTGTWLSTLLTWLNELPRAAAGPARILGLDADPRALALARPLLEAPAGWRGELELREANTLALPSVWSDAGRVRVIAGNPPWGARSGSRGLPLSDAWLREFHRDPSGAPLNERRAGVLSDDYVRFFRWALQQAREAPRGAVVCLLTNASFLDGPVHRGMRGALAHAFDRLEIIDLGGNSLRGAGGAEDQPLFPVRVGAALSVGVRRAPARTCARVTFSGVRGTRREKAAALSGDALRWTSFEPRAPDFNFRPPATAVRRDPPPGFALHEAFLFHAEGVQTNRDELATALDPEALCDRLTRIARGEIALQAADHFSPQLARERLARALEGPRDALIGELAYRPFETRAYCKLPPLCHRPRPPLAQAVAHSSLCLLSTRKQLGGEAWNMFALVERVADSSFLSTRSACRTRAFPSHAPDGSPNLAPAVWEQLSQRIGWTPQAEEVVAYAAGVLGSPDYRRAHGAALALDYARLPWPAHANTFAASVAAGRRFAELLRQEVPAEQEARAREALFVRGVTELSVEVPRRGLRWLSPHLLELGEGAQIGASDGRSLAACVGHQRIVERAYATSGRATIGALLAASARALMWAEAEQAADEAYRLTRCVGSGAKPIADLD